MKLKRVKIFGFKTFADKTDFDVDGDIISIIGPNGCGKSNIVDAILWGLGETNARNLRAQTAKEVIFSGSGARKPLGYAEVTLTFDNEDFSLPLDAAEVSVTRRLTRAGDSDYMINKRPCRLRDVNDLLADSGLGRAGYAIVSQSDIDQALSASAIQRRAWIDEAAGVQRYRARRTESIRRLEAAKGHLQRVHDIVAEIESQREPMREEAEVAKKYKTALGSLREIECGLLMTEIASASNEIAELEERIASVMASAEGDMAETERLENEAQLTASKASEMESRIEALRETHQAAQARFEQASASLQIAQHRLKNLDDLESNLAEDSEGAEDRLAEATGDLERARQEEESEKLALEKLESELAGVGSEAKELTQKLREIESELAAARSALAEHHKWELEQAHRQNRLRQVKTELKGIVDTLPDLTDGLAEAEKQTGEIEARLNEARQAIKQAESIAADARKAEEEQAHIGRQLLAQIAALDGKRRGIEATIDAHEGLAQGARAVLDAVEDGTLEGEFVPVAEAIEVEPDLAMAFDIALGAAGNDLIVPDESHAKRAIGHLKTHRLGRATFQPLTLMRPQHQSSELRHTLKSPGVVGLASELVECESRFRPVIDSLLGRVVIVEDLDTGLKLANTKGWSRIVSLDGEVVHASGAVTGGASHRQGTGMVQRRAELHAIETEIEDLQKRLSEIEKESQTREKKKQESLAASEQAQLVVDEIRQEYEDTRNWMLGLRHEHVTTIAAQKRLEDELTRLTQAPEGGAEKVDVEGIEARRDEILRKLAAKSSDADTAQTRLQEASDRANQARQRRQEAERRLANLTQAESSRSKRLENLEPERERYRKEIEESTVAVQLADEEVKSLREQVLLAIETKKALSADAARLSEEARIAQKKSASNAEILHRAELNRARADSKRSVATERLLEEYGITEEEALQEAPDVELPEDAAELATKLRKELRSMGDVNLGAIEAYERLTERYDDLHGQAEDIEAGITEINGTIRELDSLTRERFVDTFDQLKVAFNETFKKMFGGGEGVISLTEAENILDSGVDISVTVPGKRTQRLELLSGGERAMSALAFLFALLKVKPAPLVILDEVDAPLDGRNVERFIAMLRDFNHQTQFILITHNPVTIESADVWFGVTMQEPGVSTLVPLKFQIEPW